MEYIKVKQGNWNNRAVVPQPDKVEPVKDSKGKKTQNYPPVYST